MLTGRRDLVVALQRGNLEALGALYDLHAPLVFRTAVGITCDEEAAADLLQDVFLRLHRFAARIDPDRPLEPWLYRMTVNLAYTWARRQRWLHPIDDLAEWLTGDQKSSPAQMAEQSETWSELKNAIAALPIPQRTVMVMYYLNGSSLQEISQILEVPVGTIKSRLHYGRESVRRTLALGDSARVEVQYEFT